MPARSGKFKATAHKPDPDSPVMSASQVRAKYHMDNNALHRAIREGKFPAGSSTSSWLIDTSHPAFVRWIEAYKSRTIDKEYGVEMAKVRAAKEVKGE